MRFEQEVNVLRLFVTCPVKIDLLFCFFMSHFVDQPSDLREGV